VAVFLGPLTDRLQRLAVVAGGATGAFDGSAWAGVGATPSTDLSRCLSIRGQRIVQLRTVFVSQIKLVSYTIERELDCADVLGLLASQIVDQRDYGFCAMGESILDLVRVLRTLTYPLATSQTGTVTAVSVGQCVYRRIHSPRPRFGCRFPPPLQR
jgi:hypothetical protein